MRRDSFHLHLAKIIREFLPKELEEFHRGETEFGQTSTWLVGLASTLVVLAVANPERVRDVLSDRFSLVTFLLLLTVGGGVFYRISRLWVYRRISLLMRNLLGYIVGYTESVELEIPPALSEHWDEEEIVRRIQQHFEIDYRFLLTYLVPLAGCREAYEKQYAIWKEYEDLGTESLKKVIAAHFGWTDGETKRNFGSMGEARLTRVWWRAFTTRGIWVVGSILFTVSSLAFLLAIFFIASALW